MTKVKLTKEQAQELETLKAKDNLNFILNLSATRKLSKSLEIDKLNTEQIARAWLEGYEVEPQFKEGDIVVSAYSDLEHNRNKIGKIIKIYENTECCLDRGMPVHLEKYRHATDNEKIFYELGRQIGEFKEGDKYVTKTGSNRSVENSNNLKVVEGAYEQNNIKYFYPIESRKEFK